MNVSPTVGLNGELDLLSLSGQTISLKLKSPRTWTGVIVFMYILDLIKQLKLLNHHPVGDTSLPQSEKFCL